MAAIASRRADSHRLAVSYEFVKEQNGQDWGDVWVWDLDDPFKRTVEWLGLLPLGTAEKFAQTREYPFYRP